MAKIKPQPTEPSRPADGGGEGVTLAASVSTRAEVLPQQEANGPFCLSFSPYAWEVRAGRVVPRPHRIDLSPGVNGTARNGDGISITDARAAQEERGRVVILPDSTKPHADYLRRHRVPGGAFHCERWCKPIPGTDRFQVDERGYAAWLASLVDDGHLQPPSSAALGILLERLRGQMEGYARAKLDERVKAIAAEIAVVEKAAEAAEAGADGEGVTL